MERVTVVCSTVDENLVRKKTDQFWRKVNLSNFLWRQGVELRLESPLDLSQELASGNVVRQKLPDRANCFMRGNHLMRKIEGIMRKERLWISPEKWIEGLYLFAAERLQFSPAPTES